MPAIMTKEEVTENLNTIFNYHNNSSSKEHGFASRFVKFCIEDFEAKTTPLNQGFSANLTESFEAWKECSKAGNSNITVALAKNYALNALSARVELH